MQSKTASTAFTNYGSAFRVFNKEQEDSLTCQVQQISARQSLCQFLCFSSDAYIKVQRGSGVLLVSADPENSPIEEFAMTNRIRINPNVYFGFLATTPELVLHLYSGNDSLMDTVALSAPSAHLPALPQIRIQEISACHYRKRPPGFLLQEKPRQCFRLIYVESGTLHTEVDGTSWELGEKELMVCGPGQSLFQHADTQAVSYVSVAFTLEHTGPDSPENWYAPLIGRVFPPSKKLQTLCQSLIQESAAKSPYSRSLMDCVLTEIILRLFQGNYTGQNTPSPGVARQYYQDELFERILTYVESKMYEPLTVANICQHFSLSRSTLQQLFKNTLNQSPKKYISDMKLERSCQLLRESKYTISEISLKLGYSSIHYFSNAFSQKYHIPPSEYAKRIY